MAVFVNFVKRTAYGNLWILKLLWLNALLTFQDFYYAVREALSH